MTAEVARDSSEKQVKELQRHIDEMERIGVRALKNEIRMLERKVFETGERFAEVERKPERCEKLF
eukprot:gene9347-10332_t